VGTLDDLQEFTGLGGGDEVIGMLHLGAELLVAAEGRIMTISVAKKGKFALALSDCSQQSTPAATPAKAAAASPAKAATSSPAKMELEPTVDPLLEAMRNAIAGAAPDVPPEVSSAILEAVCRVAAEHGGGGGKEELQAKESELRTLNEELVRLGGMSADMAMQNVAYEKELAKARKRAAVADGDSVEIERLQSENERLQEELSSLKVFEQGAAELTNQLRAAVEEKDDISKEREDLLSLQRNMKLTWVSDAAASRCLGCESSFTMTRRRHHCRYCGRLFCNACLPCDASLPAMGYSGVVKVCTGCATLLNKDSPSAQNGRTSRSDSLY